MLPNSNLLMPLFPSRLASLYFIRLINLIPSDFQKTDFSAWPHTSYRSVILAPGVLPPEYLQWYNSTIISSLLSLIATISAISPEPSSSKIIEYSLLCFKNSIVANCIEFVFLLQSLFNCDSLWISTFIDFQSHIIKSLSGKKLSFFVSAFNITFPCNEHIPTYQIIGGLSQKYLDNLIGGLPFIIISGSALSVSEKSNLYCSSFISK